MSGNPFPEGAEPVATRGRATAAAAIVFAHTVKHIYNSGMTSLIMPEVKIGLGLTRAQFGSLATATAIAWWTSTMVSGYLGDRFSNHAGRMLAISMTLMGIAFFLVGLAPNYLTMLAVMFLAGIGPSMFHPPALGELARRFPDRRGFVVAFHGVGANIGEVFGSPIVAAFLTFLAWRDLMAGSLVPALLVALGVALLVRSRKTAGRGEITSMRGLLRVPVLPAEEPYPPPVDRGHGPAERWRDRRQRVPDAVHERGSGLFTGDCRPLHLRLSGGGDNLPADNGFPD